MRLRSGAFITSPIKSLQVETGEPSLETRRLRLSLQYYMKKKANPENPAYSCVVNPELFNNKPGTIPTLGIRLQPHLEDMDVDLDAISDEASICTAELLAIEAAIEYIWESSDEKFMIITDSLSSLQALKRQKLVWAQGHCFCWVPSHIGIRGNERTDVLAKAALDKTKQFYYIPYTDFKYNISVYLDDILQGEWNIEVTSKLFEVQPIFK